MQREAVLVCATLLLLSVTAAEYRFKGMVDAYLDHAANWDPEIADFGNLSSSDNLLINASDSAVKTLGLSADLTLPVAYWEVDSYAFDLGGHTLTLDSSASEAFYVFGGQYFRLTSGTLALPKGQFVVGRWTPNSATAEITGEATVLRCQGITLNGHGIPAWGEMAIPRFLVKDGATVDCGGGAFKVMSSNAVISVEGSTLTNLSALALCTGNTIFTKDGDFRFSQSVVEATASLIQNSNSALTGNLFRFDGGTVATAPKIELFYGSSNRLEFAGAGTVASHTYADYNGFARFGGKANVVEVSDGAVFQTTGKHSLYSSVSVGYDSNYNGGSQGVEFQVKSGGQMLVPDAAIYVGEGAQNRENRLLATGKGTYVMAGAGLAVGGSYNSQIKDVYATVCSNVVEISDGAVVSNMTMSVELPRQGWGNRALIDGGALYSGGDLSIGSGYAYWGATNNLVQITGGGSVEAAGNLSVNGATNVVRMTDGALTVAGSLRIGNNTEGCRLEVGTNGVVKAATLELKTAASELVFDLPKSGPTETPVRGNLNLASGVAVSFKNVARMEPGDYVVAETEPSGYMWIGAQDDLLATLNAQLAAVRRGTTLKKIGNNWTTGESVKLVLHVPGGAVIVIR